jgi:hypothetical protein
MSQNFYYLCLQKKILPETELSGVPEMNEKTHEVLPPSAIRMRRDR